MAVDSTDLAKLNDQELIKFADETLGIVVLPDTARQVILQKIVNASFAIREE